MDRSGAPCSTPGDITTSNGAELIHLARHGSLVLTNTHFPTGHTVEPWQHQIDFILHSSERLSQVVQCEVDATLGLYS